MLAATGSRTWAEESVTVRRVERRCLSKDIRSHFIDYQCILEILLGPEVMAFLNPGMAYLNANAGGTYAERSRIMLK